MLLTGILSSVMKLRKYLVGILMALCCLTSAKALDVSAHSAILMDGTTGQILFEKNPDEKSLIASTTKIMTALVTLEHAALHEVVEIPAAAVGIEGSSMYLKQGERLTVEQLLYGLMLSSGNDAAVALALHVSGNVDAFVELMNEKAGTLELSDVHFANPNGLDDGENYATAKALGRLTCAAMENEDFLRIVSAKSYSCSGRSLLNHNKLLWQYDGAIGVKTGYTKKAGRILVGSARRNGRTLISVTINAPEDWQDHKRLLDYGFSQYQEEAVLHSGQEVGRVPVISGREKSVCVCAADSLSLWLLPEEQPELRLSLPRFLYAPVTEGNALPPATVYLGDKPVGEIPLVVGGSVDILTDE